MSKLSLYIIKPEAVSFCKEIHTIIRSTGLVIVNFKKIVLPTEFIDNIYCDCTKKMIETTKYFLCNESCVVGIVSGTNAVETLFSICGTKTSPTDCENETIRKLYGIPILQLHNETPYYKNAIHRPKTNQEAQRDLLLFKNMFSM